MTVKARDIDAHMRSVGTWVDWAHTCDGFKYGDPDIEVEGIAVGWQSLQSALEEAEEKGCNLFVTHEPTFYSHMDDDEALKATAPAQHKMEFLERTGTVVYRCHDVWDVYPELGVVDAWSNFLELGDPVKAIKYYNLHEMPTTTAWELAQRIAQRVKPLGEQMVQFVGTRWQMVHRLAVGTGAITDVRRMVELGADAVLTTDDGIALWRDAAWVSDLGVPMIVVNHMTSEIPGLRNLADYLGEQFPEVPVEFVGPTCSYEIFATERNRDQLINMRRDDLDDLPPLDLPEEYICRPMEADEVWAYLEVMNRSNFSGEADEEWFKETFTDDRQYDPAHIQIIWKGDCPVAAAAAWHKEKEGQEWGLVHWVGVVRRERGNGLGKAIVAATLHRLRERGFERAMLGTQPWRMPALATYQSLGFEPWPDEEVPEEQWEEILTTLEEWRT